MMRRLAACILLLLAACSGSDPESEPSRTPDTGPLPGTLYVVAGPALRADRYRFVPGTGKGTRLTTGALIDSLDARGTRVVASVSNAALSGVVELRDGRLGPIQGLGPVAGFTPSIGPGGQI